MLSKHRIYKKYSRINIFYVRCGNVVRFGTSAGQACLSAFIRNAIIIEILGLRNPLSDCRSQVQSLPRLYHYLGLFSPSDYQ